MGGSVAIVPMPMGRFPRHVARPFVFTVQEHMSTAKATTDSRLMTGADVLVKSLVDHGVDVLFAYPGGCSMPMHQSLTRYGSSIRTILPRHEQGGAFAAQGYARSTGKVGVVMATSGPGATNLVTAIADAKLDSVPILCITGQVPTKAIGSDAFQETPMVEVCRGITKHHYLVTDISDLPRIMKEAFHIALSGRPGPVLVDMPKDVQLGDLTDIDMDPPMDLPGYEASSADCAERDDSSNRRGGQVGSPADDLCRWWHHLGWRQQRASRVHYEDRYSGDDHGDGDWSDSARARTFDGLVGNAWRRLRQLRGARL